MGNRVRVFLNGRSGEGDADEDRITTLFAQHSCACTITKLIPGVDLAALARQEPSNVDFIAAGGDGTVNAVANAVAGSSRRMGVLALGTLNHFAKDLGLPLELEQAVEVAAGTYVREVDSATVNGCTFINNSSLGVYPGMVIERERMKKSGWNKWTSLVFASARAFARFRCLEVELKLDGEVKRCTTPFLFVGNNEYCIEGSRLGKREHLDHGQLSLYLAPGATRSTMLRLAFAALFGRMKQEPEYQQFLLQEFTVKVPGRRVKVSCDGEVRTMTAPVNYRIRPKSLHVLCSPVLRSAGEAK